MAELDQSLLTGSAGAGEKSRYRNLRRCACGLLVISAVVLILVQTGPKHVNASLKMFAGGWGDASCYTATGGTCNVQGCNYQRHATCSTWGKQCYCEGGGSGNNCVGADGNCHSDGSTLVASNFKLRNVKYDDQYLYASEVSVFSQLRTTRAPDDTALFNLYRLPGKLFQSEVLGTNISRNSGIDAYFLQPVKQPEYTVGLASSNQALGSQLSVDLFHMTHRVAAADAYPFDPAQMMMKVCTPSGHSDAVEFDAIPSSIVGGSALYIHHGSWLVYGWAWSSPSTGGYWTPEPAFDFTPESCGY